MKKIFLVAVIALLATPLFASDMKFDGKFGYARIKGGANGFVIGPAMYYSLYTDTGFVKDISIGLGLDFVMAKTPVVLTVPAAWVYNILVGPEARLEMPYSYFKVGFGYDYTYDHTRVSSTNSNALGMKVGLGGLYEIAEGTKLGLDFTFIERLTDGTAWSINVGPMVSFDL